LEIINHKNRNSPSLFYKWAIFFGISIFLSFSSIAQVDGVGDSTNCQQKRKWVTIGGSTLYFSSITALSFLWYQENFGGGYKFINDGNEWRGMDKIGHAYSAYYQSYYVSQLMRAACCDSNQVFWIGGLSGFFMQLPIEILDGFSADYGASTYDIVFNGIGAGLYMAQEKVWKKQKILPKFSFYPSSYAQFNPSLLGSTLPEQLIKDYNGQNYWLSFNLQDFLHSPRIPNWLCLSLGYGIDGVLRGTEQDQINDINLTELQRNPSYRKSEILLSLDIDLRKLKVRKQWQRTLLHSINFLKIPFPTVIYSTDGNFRVSGLYY
jgi:hypothetical protein